MTFLQPWAFWLMLPVALLLLLRFRQIRYPEISLDERLLLGSSKHPFLHLLSVLSLMLMVVALARPVLKKPSVQSVQKAKAVYLAIDTSQSMYAKDRLPNRFSYAKSVIEHLLEIDVHHPFGLIAFTTNALILSPPTEDHRLIGTALESLNTEYIITHGTDMKALLEFISRMPEATKRLVIFSDGGDDHDLSALVNLSKESGIIIYSVACASERGSPIPERSGAWLKDKNGNMVISIQNPILKHLAKATGGNAIKSADAATAAQELYDALSDELFLGTKNVKMAYSEIFWIPLMAALLLYLSALLSMPRFLKRFLVPLLLLTGIHAEAGMLDRFWLHRAYDAYNTGDLNATEAALSHIAEPSLQREYTLGALYYAQGAYKKAGQTFASIESTDPKVKQNLLYNLGNCAVKLGRYKSARAFYVNALQLGDDPESVENLSQILFLIQKQKKKPIIHANRSVKASGTGSSSEKKKSSSQRESKKSGQGQSGGGGAKGGGVKKVRKPSEPGNLKHPVGSKAYDLINKGYTNEARPW